MIPAANSHLHVAAKTHEGMRGKNNEDLFSISAYQLGPSDPTPVLFAILADGIGGHRAGEVASQIAVEMISEAVAQSDGSQPTAIMQAAIIQASQAILAQAVNDQAKEGMGTTVACVWIINDRLYVASVGNSRIYILRSGQLIQINVDHTWVQEAIKAGALTPEQARGHPQANVIRRYLGSQQPADVDLRLRLSSRDNDTQALANQGARLLPGDRLLLCSDGLNDMVEDSTIKQLLLDHELDQAARRLINTANQNGGKDNITVILLEMPQQPGLQLPLPNFEHPVQLGIFIGIAALIGFVLLVIFAWLGLRALSIKDPTPTATTGITITALPTLTKTSLPSLTPTASQPPATATQTTSPTLTYTPSPSITLETAATETDAPP